MNDHQLLTELNEQLDKLPSDAPISATNKLLAEYVFFGCMGRELERLTEKLEKEPKRAADPFYTLFFGGGIDECGSLMLKLGWLVTKTVILGDGTRFVIDGLKADGAIVGRNAVTGSKSAERLTAVVEVVE